MVRVVIADDHALLRSGLARLLHAGHEIVGETADGEATQATVDAVRPDLLLLDSYREIGARLHLGQRTIETYRRRIADKLGVRSRAELVAYALRHGLVQHPVDIPSSG